MSRTVRFGTWLFRARCAEMTSKGLGNGWEERHMAGARSGRRKRQANVPGGRTSPPFKVKCTNEERDLLRIRAAAEGVSVPRLLIESTLNPHWRAESSEGALTRREQAAQALGQAADARNLLVAIGRNINQIAKHVNSTNGEIPQDLSVALAAVQRTCDEVTRRMREVATGRSTNGSWAGQ